MTYHTELADVLRAAGLTVVEVPGWKTRGHGEMATIGTIVCHHTATPASYGGDYPSLAVVRDGRPDLAGPLAQLGLGRGGTWYTIAAGKSWHAGPTFETAQDNSHSIGIEAEADGKSAWPAVQMESYVRGCRALADHFGLKPARVQGHKEVASPLGRKSDPNFDMAAFRYRVATLTPKGPDDMPFTKADADYFMTYPIGGAGIRVGVCLERAAGSASAVELAQVEQKVDAMTATLAALSSSVAALTAALAGGAPTQPAGVSLADVTAAVADVVGRTTITTSSTLTAP